MKKITALSVLLLFVTALAYGQVSSAYKTAVESIFKVDRNFVNTGLLQDYGFFYTNVEKFNGIRSDTNYIDYPEWQLLYNSLYTYRFNSKARIQEPQVAFENIERKSTGEAIAIVGLHFRYERFRSNAVSARLVYILNNKIYDTPRRMSTPYEVKEAFAFVPTRTALRGSYHQFVLKSESFYSNTGKAIETVTADFGDGQGFRTMNQDIPVQVYYQSDGEKTFVFRVVYSDGTSRESHAKARVTGTMRELSTARSLSSDSNQIQFPIADFISPKPYQGRTGRAKVSVMYAGAEKVIRKPLIVVEGFDPWKILHPNNPNENYDVYDFLFGNQISNGLNVEIGVDYPGQTLYGALWQNNYDIIFIDFDDCTDYIQRNAFLVANIIQWVNAKKQPLDGVLQQNVVIGISMGGLVARYALRDMELNSPSVAHDTRLNISIDSPHQGANVPIAFQAAVLHLAGSGIGVGLPGMYVQPEGSTFAYIFPALGRGRSVLNTPAARQMLMYQLIGGGSVLVEDNRPYQNFMNEYRSLGMPAQNGIRNVVLASGSECGTDQGFGPGSAFIDETQRFKVPWWATLLSNIFSPVFAFTNYPQAMLGSPLTTRTDVSYYLKMTALPDRRVQEVYRFRLYIRKKILFVINMNITLIEKSYSSSASHLAVDNAAGGVYDLSKLSDVPLPLAISKFCFVPTFSALDIGTGIQSMTSRDLIRDYSPARPPAAPKNVRAANFFTNHTKRISSNVDHTRVTTENGRWLFQEIQGRPVVASCFASCGNAVSIVGPSAVCPTATYALEPSPTTLPVFWSSSDTTRLSINKKTGEATRLNGAWATVTIFAKTGEECNAAIKKDIQLGMTFPISIYGPDVLYGAGMYSFVAEVGGDFSYYTYDWSVPAGWGVPEQSANGITVYVPANAWGSGVVTVTVTNECGDSNDVKHRVDFPYWYASSKLFEVTPNPATSTLAIQIIEQTETNTLVSAADTISQDEEFMVELVNNFGEVVLTGKNNGRRLDLPVAQIPRGIYLLKVHHRNAVEVKRIVIE